ncbi:hypothetical protein PMIN01_08196 [Paraphaeosphaeria minitans]|uniref:Uncharacterized protein n=1 Tax=Paraphaeosphaeria minitans TaxID=565426 RepID=A0A9P6KNQ5_9PLEO|nr:hypothetical protein PMIN01_08196 [Paraphaeosphaeria minitans]
MELLCSDLHSCTYQPITRKHQPQPGSLSHLHPRFRRKDVELDIVLVPSFDVHIGNTVSTVTYSASGVPYPALHILVQSFLDTYDVVSLCDIIDGTDISEEWGNKSLDLSGTNDVQWAGYMNERYFASIARRGGNDVTIISNSECRKTGHVGDLCTTEKGKIGMDAFQWYVRYSVSIEGMEIPGLGTKSGLRCLFRSFIRTRGTCDEIMLPGCPPSVKGYFDTDPPSQDHLALKISYDLDIKRVGRYCGAENVLGIDSLPRACHREHIRNSSAVHLIAILAIIRCA